MSKVKEKTTGRSELRVKGLLVENGVKVSEKEGIDALSSRGYGVAKDDDFLLTFYDGLYLLDKGNMEIEDGKSETVNFQGLLQHYGVVDENAWAKYLTYRDLRSRGYVVRRGFGLGIDFRVYERGGYGEETAKLLVLSMQEGKPKSLEDLTRVLRQCQSLKKELVLAVMNRRGEIVYYSVSQLTLK